MDSTGTVLSTAISTVTSTINPNGEGPILTDLNSQISKIDSNATVLSTAISDFLSHLSSNSSGIIADDFNNEMAKIHPSASTLSEAISNIQNKITSSGTNVLSDDLDKEIKKLNAGSTELSIAISDVTSVMRDLLTGANGSRFNIISYTGVESQIFGANPTFTPGGGIVILVIEGLTYVFTFTEISQNDNFSFVTGYKSLTFKNTGNIISDINEFINLFNDYLVLGSAICGSDSLSKANFLRDQLNSSSSNIQSSISSVKSLIGGNISSSILSLIGTLQNIVTLSPTEVLKNDLLTQIGKIKSDGSVLSTSISEIENSLLTTPTGIIDTDIQSINSLLNGTSLGLTTQSRIGSPMMNSSSSNLKSIIGGTSSDLSSQLGDPGVNSLISNIGGSTTSIQSALEAISNQLINSTSFSSSLSSSISTISTNLDNIISSLPSGYSYLTVVSSPVSDGVGGINITFLSAGTYNLDAITISNGISNGSTFSFVNGSNSLVLYNRSGSTFSTQGQMLKYLRSIYPISSYLSTDVSSIVNRSIKNLIGGSSSVIRTRLGHVDSIILDDPTGVILTDLSTVRGYITSSPSSSIQSDIEQIKSTLNSNSDVSSYTLKDIIGEPTSNASASSIANIISSGSSDSLSYIIGDPILGDTGLSGLINYKSINNNNGVFTEGIFNQIQNGGTDITGQIQQIIYLFDPSNWVNQNSPLTFTFSSPPTSLADIINAASINLPG
uniref:Uncharacterized protein n=1 Tax=viral metagenome TaxID=1070528 RepID=A0A6C0BFC4_9ZZZZ